MKKFLSVVLLVCIMASMCSVSAYADTPVKVDTKEALENELLNSSATVIELGGDIELVSDICVNRAVDVLYGTYTLYGDGDITTTNPDLFVYTGETGLFLKPDADSNGLHIVGIPDYPEPISIDITSSYKNTVNSGEFVPELTAAMQFIADPTVVTCAQYYYYKDWYADFRITINSDATFQKYPGQVSGESPADGYLAGQYDTNGGSWEIVPFGNVAVSVPGNTPFNIMQYAGFPVTVEQVYTMVGTFNCGIFFTEEYIANHPDDQVVIALDMHEDYDSSSGEYGGNYKTLTAQSFRLAPPKPASSVPATADNSNVPLWVSLFVLFTAAAVLSGKKRKA